MECSQKHRFFRWYRVSDCLGQLSIFQVVAWGFLGKQLCSSNLGRFRVYRNQHMLSAFKVIEWIVLRSIAFLGVVESTRRVSISIWFMRTNSRFPRANQLVAWFQFFNET